MWNLKLTEFDVQVEVVLRLREAGFTVKGEARYKRAGARGVRADVLVFRDGQPALIIEAKRSSGCRRDTKQAKRYTEITGLPVLLACGMEGAYSIAARVRMALMDE